MPTINHHQISFPSFSFDNSKELKLVYVIRVVRSLVVSVALFFVPLFLFQLAPQMDLGPVSKLSEFKQGIFLISAFYILGNLAGALSTVEIGKIISKIGHGRAFVLSQLMLILSLVLLRISSIHPYVIFLATLVYGVERIIFWNSYKEIMVKNTLKSKTGRDLGLVQFFINFMMMVSPALGGMVIKFLGYDMLFLYTSVILLVGIVSALMMKSKPFKDVPSWSEFKNWLREKTFLRFSLAVGGKYFHEAGVFVWPLYVFLILGSVDKVGLLHTFSLFLAMILSFFIGYHVDHAKSKKPFWLSGVVMSSLWFLRINIFSIWGIAISDMINKIFQNYHGIFFDRKLFNRARGVNTYSYFVYHELVICFSAVFFWILFMVVFLASDMGWIGIFLIGAFGSLLSLLIKEHK